MKEVPIQARFWAEIADMRKQEYHLLKNDKIKEAKELRELRINTMCGLFKKVNAKRKKRKDKN